MTPQNGRNFRKSATSEEKIEFWRPCRGLSPFQGLAPGRAAKIRLQPRRRHFFENFGHFGLHARTYPSVQLFLKRIDGHHDAIPG